MPRTALRPIFALLFAACLPLLAACAAPATSGGAASEPPATTNPPKPMSSPYPPREAGAAKVDYGCRSNADCAVKNVGNCCGAMPACVNKDSPTDPAGVQAECAASGRMSVCGFTDVAACQCVDGRCEADSSIAKLPAR